MEISEKVAYLKGLADGLDVSKKSNEGRLLLEVLDVLEEMAASIDGLEFDMDVVGDELDSIDNELDAIFHNDFPIYEHIHGHDHHHDCHDYDDGYDDYDGDIYQVICPNCGDVVLSDEEMLDEGEIVCPECGQHLEFDFSGEIED